MPDEFDAVQERIDAATDNAVAEIRSKAKLEPGIEGECELCGEWMLRLVAGACAPCRDRYKLP